MQTRQSGRYFLGVVALTLVMLALLVPRSALAASQSPVIDPSAANQSALAVSPAITEQVTPAGKPKAITVQVTNTTGFPLPISSKVKNFIPYEQIEDTADSAKYDASKWFIIADPDFILQPKETRKVSITITPPLGAEPGGHYATIYFTPLIPETALSPSTAYLSAQVGTLAFLIVPGALTEKLSVSQFSTSSVHQSRSVDFSARLKNSGSVHLSPNATITITGWRGKKITELPIKAGIVLPGTEKSVAATWESAMFIGRYTATLQVQYGQNHTSVPAVKVSFWIIPWGLLLAVGLPLILGVLVYFKTRGRWRRAWQILRRGH